MHRYENSVYKLTDVHFGHDRRHRYYLQGEVKGQAASQPHLIVFQLNPSKAGTERSDPTVGKVCNWASRERFAAVHFFNLFGFIETVQANVNTTLDYSELVGPEMDKVLEARLSSCPRYSKVVLAYGEPEGVLKRHCRSRIVELRATLSRHFTNVWSVGSLTASGFPRHGRGWNKGSELTSRSWDQFLPQEKN